jgi:hydroxyethylthiazole kinase
MMTLDAGRWLTEVRQHRPLVHNMTNVVVTNAVANALLALGASPVMAYAHEEVQDMARIAGALALNMGTLTPDLITGMILAGQAAGEARVPIVFDPVGFGATPYRIEAAREVVAKLGLTVLKGNAGEIGGMTGAGGTVSGVDAVQVGANLAHAMTQFARAHQTILVSTGVQDFVTDGKDLWVLSNGHPLLAHITGSGCMLTGVIGAFLAVADKESGPRSFAEASVAAITCFNIAAEKAAQQSQGPGTFSVHFFDELSALDPNQVNDMARIACQTALRDG